MLFNSINFAIFLPIVFTLYWLLNKQQLKFQNILLLVSSYFFYACWDYRFLFLLIFSTLLDFYTGLKMEKANNDKHRKFWFGLSVAVNLGFLGLFKYYNFFSESFAQALSLMGIRTNFVTLQIVLPVGISFYTFHGLSYVIDIFKRRIRAEKNFIDYAVFVSFFPLLVAGPIERATHLLPQIQKRREFKYEKAIDGLRQILWGILKKVVLADNCAEYANIIFNDSENYSGFTLFIGALFFAIQIYCDFSGYSDIALGTARLFGIELLRNFSFPYFSRDIAEFWRRWHISLSSWFRDYLYIPLGGSKGGTWMKIRNTFIIFIISGFWHGANWTFIIWGALNAIYFLPLLLNDKNRVNLETVAHGKFFPTPKEFFSMMLTFLLTTLAWIFFRAQTVTQALHYIKNMYMGFTQYKSHQETLFFINKRISMFLLLIIGLFFIMEWLGREKQYALAEFGFKWPKVARWTAYCFIIWVVFYLSGKEQQFIYFQF